MWLCDPHFARATTIVIVLLSTACAHTPKVTLGYYLPRSEIHLKVDRVLACSKSDRVVEVVAVTPTPRFVADRSKWKLVSIADVDGSFADADLKFEFYDDGRLKAVNAATTGKGEDVIKSAISLIGAVAFDETRGADIASCKTIRRLSEKAKSLTLTYEGTIKIVGDGTIPIEPIVSSAAAHKELAAGIGGVCAVIKTTVQTNAPEINTQGKGARLTLVQPGAATVTVTSGGKNRCVESTHWVAEVLAPQFGKEYELPIPKAAMFGKQVFEVSVGESGTLSSVKYGKETGANQALTVLNTVLPQLQKTTTEQTAEANEEADKIKALARLAKCRADPASCE